MPQRSLFWICVVLIALSCGGENDAAQNKVNDKQAIDDPKTKDAKDPSISENLLTEIRSSSETLNAKSKIIDTLFLSIHSSVQDGFALMCKFESENEKLLKTYVFDRNSKGELIQTNAFDGILLGKDTLVSNYPRLMMRFVEFYGKMERYYYNCWFSFDPLLDKYEFDHCLSINKAGAGNSYFDVYVSEAETSESQLITNKEVFSILEKNNYLN